MELALVLFSGSNSNATSNFHLGAASGVFRLWNGDIGLALKFCALITQVVSLGMTALTS